MKQWLLAHSDPDLAEFHKLASFWVAAFWGAFGAGIWVLNGFVTIDNAYWLAPLILFMAATFGIARFTHQPGAE